MRIRDRRDADIDECVRIAEAVQQVDGYPPYLPTGLGQFIASGDAIRAWVAEDAGRIIGHVALHNSSSPPVMELATVAAGEPADRLCVVARLFVDPSCRRVGTARQLLATATTAGAELSRRPVLDVGTRFAAAIRLYDAAGWIRAGEVSVPIADNVLREFVYLSPPMPA